jgi:hypothetical protein
MSAHLAHSGLVLPRPARPSAGRQASPARRASPARATSFGWIERLALWAERQPQHHRLGSYLVRG